MNTAYDYYDTGKDIIDGYKSLSEEDKEIAHYWIWIVFIVLSAIGSGISYKYRVAVSACWKKCRKIEEKAAQTAEMAEVVAEALPKALDDLEQVAEQIIEELPQPEEAVNTEQAL